jgi:mono/diheme cytochrome c family protein
MYRSKYYNSEVSATHPVLSPSTTAWIPPIKLFASFLLATVALTVGCDDEEQTSRDGIENLSECVNTWEAHYLKRVPVGSTRWLPSFIESEACPTDLTWSLESAPDAGSPPLHQETDSGLTRFTPMSAGDYTFNITQGGEVISAEGLTLNVVDALDRPFHNYNYYPSSHAAVKIGDEVWIAGVSSPQVARLSASDGETLSAITVGGWPVGLAYANEIERVLVTQKGDDTLGLIDVNSAELVDAIWVGDEPSEVLWDASRSRAYVSLAGAGKVAVVDLNTKELITTIDAVFDAQAMALSPDQQTLVVASRRSGQTQQFPYADREVSEERDIALINLETLDVTGHILEVASTIHALRYNEAGELWVSATSNHTEGSLNDPDALSFVHEIFLLDVSVGEAQRSAEVDLTRQATSGGSTGVTGGFTWCGGQMWVAAEGANAAIALDDSLAESRRINVRGRPRVTLCVDDTPWIISTHRQEVTRVIADEALVSPLGLSDQRTEAFIVGFELFHGQGEGAGDNRSCSACHADGLSDGVVWNAGPVENRQVTRPLRWLEGTEMIGWDGYVGSVEISGYVGGSTINKRGDTESSIAMGTYLASLMPAPAATSLTQRDGSLSPLGKRGKALFNGEASCGSCHGGAVTTSRAVLSEGLTPGKTDIPTLVDVARIGSWYKTGEMPSLEATLDDTAEKFNVVLANDEREALFRYLQELTARDFFTLRADLGPDESAVGIDATIELTFSYPVLDSAENLSLITLKNGDEEPVDINVSAEGRHVFISPVNALSHETEYTINLSQELRSDAGHLHIEEGRSRIFTTAAAPRLQMVGEYTFTAQLPFFDIAQGTFDPERSLPSVMSITATQTDSGSSWDIDYGQDMVYSDRVVLGDDQLYTRHLPISAGPSFLNGQPLQVEELTDDDDDGIIDRITGTMTLTGPGLDYEDRSFTIEAASASGACPEGEEGPLPLTITQEADDIIIDWGDGLSLSLFVTSPEAVLPLGPLSVMGGETYWSLAPIEFPNGFAAPVTYGVVPEGAMDATTTHDGPEGGATLQAGACYKFGVLVDFVYSTRTMVWPPE